MSSLLIPFVALSTFAASYSLTPLKITPHVYCFFGKNEIPNKHNNGNISNSCFVILKNGVAVFDTGPTYMYAKEEVTQIRKITPKKIKYVINSHYHDDHILGNSYYATLGVRIYGTKEIEHKYQNTTNTRMQQHITKESYKDTQLVLPTHYVTKSITLDNELQVIPIPHPAHTKSDLIAFYPKERVVFAGDIIFNDRLPSIRDGDIEGWLKAIDFILSLKPKYIIGGHGMKYDTKAYIFTKEYLQQLRKEFKKAIEDGIELDEVTTKITLPQYKNMKLYKELHRKNVFKAYQIYEWEEE
ncbi:MULTISPECIES: MBL fold metallo-hydrolase [unclassified Nitratiruptor]|uniref:MBL fold metallo-hydrolase n=1 Tax=unclassified Nitratiruptor TaxID=2624044 RepID=UPI0019164C37|nr:MULTISPECIES: MBL fold metallo-hydrolase [unclassified Nitratiruptor]BCD59779.1 hypothetical protein NitYY0810_C0535 [Nitratiruptor sp. YY08-10]BCD63703.1 hypothetical protein NitYY0814_C0535 [Nitratiruptor sp. YY08-14]